MMRGFGGHMGWGLRGFGYGAFGNNGFWLPMLIEGIVELFLLGAVIYIVYRLLKKRGSFSNGTTDQALEILKTRYAQGEITEEEFNERKKLLS